MPHYTRWEDEQLVEYYCSQRPDERGHTLSSDDGVQPCYACHKPLKLTWLVYVEEVIDPLQVSIQDAAGGPQ